MLLLCYPQPPLPRKDQQGDSYNPRQTTCLQDHPKFLKAPVPLLLTCLAAMVSSLELFFTISR